MKHIDLYSGIGGFSLACDWAGIETIGFVEIDKFCQKVLKKYWPNVPIVEDVNNVEEIVAYTQKFRDSDKSIRGINPEYQALQGELRGSYQQQGFSSLLLTAGFPCQPFSAAGRRKGSADSRYLWPQTLAVIEAVKPDWVLLENVAGILSMVFPDSKFEMASQATILNNEADKSRLKYLGIYSTILGGIIKDLEKTGYEVAPPLVIPACAVNAPHRRDRVWIVAHSIGNLGQPSSARQEQRGMANENQQKTSDVAHDDSALYRPREQQVCTGRDSTQLCNQDVASTCTEGLQGRERSEPLRLPRQFDRGGSYEKPDWTENWYEVATRFCRVDDGIPNRVDRLKSLGNAIVPQVAFQLIKAIKEAENAK